MDDQHPHARLETTARRLAASPTSTTALVSVDDPKRARAWVERLLGVFLRSVSSPWRVRWLGPSASSEIATLGQAADAEPLLLILDASQAMLVDKQEHDSWLRELNSQRELLRRKDALIVVLIVVPTWLGRRFPELAPDTYSVLDQVLRWLAARSSRRFADRASSRTALLADAAGP